MVYDADSLFCSRLALLIFARPSLFAEGGQACFQGEGLTLFSHISPGLCG